MIFRRRSAGRFPVILAINGGLAACFWVFAQVRAQEAPEDWQEYLEDDPSLLEKKAEDGEWANYIEEIQPEYDEKGFPEVSSKDPSDYFFSDRRNWSLTGRGEAPYLAVIYQLVGIAPLDREKHILDGVRKGRACGGVLVAPERLITSCGCVFSYVAAQSLPNGVNVEYEVRPHFPFDMGWKDRTFAKGALGINRIYVQYGMTRFINDTRQLGWVDYNDRHLVDDGTGEGAFITDQDCGYELMQQNWPGGKLVPVISEKKLNKKLVLVGFYPAIKYPIPGQFINWPPTKLDRYTTQFKGITVLEQVTVTGIGFQKKRQRDIFHDDEGNEIPLSLQAINIPFRHCMNEDTHTCFNSFSLEEKMFQVCCFCALHDPEEYGYLNEEICDGTIGWPVIYLGSVVALTVTPRDCYHKGSRVLATTLSYSSFQKQVEYILTRERLEKLNTERPPMFREDLIDSSYVFYDYPEHTEWLVHEGTMPALIPFSAGVAIRPTLLLGAFSVLSLFLSI